LAIFGDVLYSLFKSLQVNPRLFPQNAP